MKPAPSHTSTFAMIAVSCLVSGLVIGCAHSTGNRSLEHAREPIPCDPESEADVSRIARKAYPLSGSSCVLKVVPLTPLSGAAPRYHTLMASDGYYWVLQSVAFEFCDTSAEELEEQFGTREELEAIANSWANGGSDALYNYYFFERSFSGRVLRFARSESSERLHLQNACGNVALLESWNRDPQRPRASSLYFDYLEEKFAIHDF